MHHIRLAREVLDPITSMPILKQGSMVPMHIINTLFNQYGINEVYGIPFELDEGDFIDLADEAFTFNAVMFNGRVVFRM